MKPASRRGSPAQAASLLRTTDRPLNPINHSTMQKRVYDDLRDAFLESRFVPGQALTMRALAEMTGTSVQPVREALQRLCAEGALEWLPNTAFRVPGIDPERYRELWSLRKLLEGQATRLASQSMSRADMTELKRINREMRAAMRKGDRDQVLRLNRDFHFTIYRAAQSPVLVSFIEMIWMRVSPLFAAFTHHELGLPESGLRDNLPAASEDFFGLQDRLIEALADKRADQSVAALDQVLDLSAHLFLEPQANAAR